MRRKLLLNIFVYFIWLQLISSLAAIAQPAEYKMTRQEYIIQFKEDAIREMQLHGVPASITLAQGMLESGNGNSALATYANNHFGIKCHTDWKGASYIQNDDKKNECFRKYPTVLDSYNDHSEFLKSRARYAFLFQLNPTDYKAWAKGLKESGYATEPKYSERLIELIEVNKLYDFDTFQALSSVQPEKEKHTLSFRGIAKKIMLVNNIKYLTVKVDDTFDKIAVDYGIHPPRLRRYNDLSKDDKLIPGEKLFIQPKRRKALEEFHIVQKGETMHSISQLHGIKLKKLYTKNQLKPGQEPQAGDKLWLRECRPRRRPS